MTNAVQTTARAGGNGALQQQPQQQQQPERQQHVVPPVDVFEDDSAITLLADLPGVPREQLNVRVDGETLVLEATAAAAGPESLELVYGEAQCPAYRRQFTLSRELDTSRIEAQMRDGVLRLTIPKADKPGRGASRCRRAEGGPPRTPSVHNLPAGRGAFRLPPQPRRRRVGPEGVRGRRPS